MRPSASVIVPVHGDARGLSTALERLSTQTYPADRTELIVVDNGCAVELEALQRRFPRVTWLEEPEPGSYRARNAGVAAARGQVISFTDSDCQPAGDWVERGVAALVAAPHVGFVGGRIDVAFEDPVRPSVCELYDRSCSFNQRETISRFGYAATANLFTTADVIEAVGPFDGGLRSGGDCEWCNRVVRAGWSPSYHDDVVVTHPARGTFRALLAKSLRVTVGSMTTSETLRRMSVAEYVRYHLVSRPGSILRTMRGEVPPVPARMAWRVVGLYYLIKCAQIGERLRVVAGGTPRR